MKPAATTAPAWAAVLLFLVGSGLAATTAVSADLPPNVSALLDWKEAHFVGEAEMAGPAWSLRVGMDRQQEAPASAFLFLEGSDVEVRQEFRDYKSTPGGQVGTDTQAQSVVTSLGASRLTLEEARREIQFLVVPAHDAPAAFALDSPLRTAKLAPVDQYVVSLWSMIPGTDPPPHVQRTYEHNGPAVVATSERLDETSRISGNFIVYLWDVDLKEDAHPENVYESGTLREDGPGESDLAPHGLVWDTRIQLLTVVVHDGQFRFNVPGRPAESYYEPATTGIEGSGSWDLTQVSGHVNWNGAQTRVDQPAMHLEGRFGVYFTSMAETGTVRTRWAGDATQVEAAAQPASAPVVPLLSQHRFPWWAVWMGLAGAVAGTAVVVRQIRRRALLDGVDLEMPLAQGDYARALQAAEVALDSKDGDARGADGPDALVAKCVALLKLGRAGEVVATLGPRVNEKEPLAPLKCYLLSLAHVNLGHLDEGADWILRAVHLYPEFARELASHSAFAPIRERARVRSYLQTQGVATGYA